MQRPLKRGILGASTIILSTKDIDKYAFMCGSNFYETDIKNEAWVKCGMYTKTPKSKPGYF